MLADPQTRGVLLSPALTGSGAVFYLTSFATPGLTSFEPLTVKIPGTVTAGWDVEREGRMLVALRRLRLGPLEMTLPRYVESRRVGELPALVSTSVFGTAMRVDGGRRRLARPARVRGDFAMAGRWLADLQEATRGRPGPVTWAGDLMGAIAGRWDGHPLLGRCLAALQVSDSHLRAETAPTSVVHGDFRPANVRVKDGEVSGVVNWQHCHLSGSPLCDPTRFALMYAAQLGGPARSGLPRHRRQATAGGLGAGIWDALSGDDWFGGLVRSFISNALERVGVRPECWYDAARAALAEAAIHEDDETGQLYLELLAGLPMGRPWGRHVMHDKDEMGGGQQ
ncbi:MAG: phosphotransferase family protein [Nocardioidaceae bacterium]